MISITITLTTNDSSVRSLFAAGNIFQFFLRFNQIESYLQDRVGWVELNDGWKEIQKGQKSAIIREKQARLHFCIFITSHCSPNNDNSEIC